MSGWIKIHRKILHWEWYNDSNTFRLFMHLLLKANHKDKNYRGIVVTTGSVLTGRDLLSIETGLSVQQVRTCLERLKSTNEITINSSRQGTIIQIVKYKDYQVLTNDLTENQPQDNQQVTTNKNIKNIKNEKNINIDGFLSWFNLMKEKYVGSKGKFSTLNKTSINNLDQLKQQNLTQKDWEHAFKMMCSNEWVKQNQMQTPSHFLVNDNFYRYLNQEDNTSKFDFAWNR